MSVIQELTEKVTQLNHDHQQELLSFADRLIAEEHGGDRNSALLQRGRELLERARLRNQNVPEEVLNAEIDAAVAEVRRRK